MTMRFLQKFAAIHFVVCWVGGEESGGGRQLSQSGTISTHHFSGGPTAKIIPFSSSFSFFHCLAQMMMNWSMEIGRGKGTLGMEWKIRSGQETNGGGDNGKQAAKTSRVVLHGGSSRGRREGRVFDKK